MTAAPGIRWCTRCQVHQVLARDGRLCPVCDDSQADEVRARADAALARVDEALAGADAYSSAARWHPGLDQDETPTLTPGPRLGAGLMSVRYDETHEWAALGHGILPDIVLGGDDDADTPRWGDLRRVPLTTSMSFTIPMDSESSDGLRALFFGDVVSAGVRVISEPTPWVPPTPRLRYFGDTLPTDTDTATRHEFDSDDRVWIGQIVTFGWDGGNRGEPADTWALNVDGTIAILTGGWSCGYAANGYRVGSHTLGYRITPHDPDSSPFTHLYVNQIGRLAATSAPDEGTSP